MKKMEWQTAQKIDLVLNDCVKCYVMEPKEICRC